MGGHQNRLLCGTCALFEPTTTPEAELNADFAQAPLEVEASARFKEIVASESHQELNIGTKYSGDFEWLSGF